MYKTSVFGFLLALALPASAQVLQRVSIRTPDAPKVAHELQSDGYDVLEGSIQKGSLQLVVSPESMTELMALGFRPTVLETGRPFYEVEAQRMRDAAETGSPDAPPAGYPDLANVLAQMQTAAANFPSICQFVNLTSTYGTPKTFGNRSLFAIKISDNVAVDEDEQAILIVSAHHCRETVTPVTALHAMDQLTTMYGIDPVITNLVDTHEIWIAPVWNPDGYNFVWTNNNLWRKNRRVFTNGVGVDLNRNYGFGWSAPCGGSTNVRSDTYRGPSAFSEAETQTMRAWSEAVRFSKVLDFHSFGRETLWTYGCDPHPLSSYLQSEAISLSQAANYGNKNRLPSADGEHFEWQLNHFGAYSFLMEISTAFQPPFSSAQSEAVRLFPAIVQLINEPVPVSGHVTDAMTGAPVEATIVTRGINFQRGELNRSDPKTGRYHMFYPRGNYITTFSAPGYRDACSAATIGTGQTAVRDVQMMPLGACPVASVTNRNPAQNPDVYRATPAIIGQPSTLSADTQGFAFATFIGRFCPQDRSSDRGVVLIDIEGPAAFVSGPHPGPIASANVVISNDPALCGLTVYSQAKLHNATGPFVITNSQDFILGM